jgi:dipeptidyl aminopeptidase/acylaminoacyl peptidase
MKSTTVSSADQIAAPAGHWESPISSELIAGQTTRLRQLAFHDGVVYWTESRPKDNGRIMVVAHDGETQRDLIPDGFGAGSRLHEYGGGDFCIAGDRLVFSNAADQGLYVVPLAGGEPGCLSNPEGWRFGEMVWDAKRRRVVAVAEIHRQGQEVENAIVAVTEGSSEPEFLVQGEDFYASPKLNEAADQMCWISWNHPNMPWDETSLWVAGLDDEGNFLSLSQIDDGEQSIVQPRWLSDDSLGWISDRSNWWNIYREGMTSDPVAVAPMAAECAVAPWLLGASSWGESDNGIVTLANQKGIWKLGKIVDRAFAEIALPYTWLDNLHVAGRQAACFAGSPSHPNQVILIDLDTSQHRVIASSSQANVDPQYIAAPKPISFPTTEGDTSYGLFYPASNPKYRLPEGEKSPLIVTCHGGPTSASTSAQDLRRQFWTSRGFSILDLNYRGSTGYGREYRRKLYGNWGIHDVDDCVAAVNYLTEQGLIDPNRAVISGGSAGGYTVLGALTFKDVFKAGASYYGVADVKALCDDTHKFESRYIDQLIGPIETHAEVYQQRSAIHNAEKLNCPVVFFQGMDDKVVPPAQSSTMAKALEENGIYQELWEFQNEGHGFLKAKTIIAALEAELAFYIKTLGL